MHFIFHIQFFFPANLVGGGVPGEAGNYSINSNIKYQSQFSSTYFSGSPRSSFHCITCMNITSFTGTRNHDRHGS